MMRAKGGIVLLVILAIVGVLIAKENIKGGPLPGSMLFQCLESGIPTMADFGIGTCEICKAMAPTLKQGAIDYVGKANVLFIELDKYPDLARKYKITARPTQIFFDASGKEVSRHMGYMDRAEIDCRLAAAGVKP